MECDDGDAGDEAIGHRGQVKERQARRKRAGIGTLPDPNGEGKNPGQGTQISLPAFTISAFIARGGQSKSKLLIDGLRKAGLPE